jgi:hypothetical protein
MVKCNQDKKYKLNSAYALEEELKMKKFLIEYIVIPNGTTHYNTVEETSKKAAKENFERAYDPEKIISVKQLKEDMYL